MCAEPYRTLLKTDRNCLDSWCAGPTDRRFHRRNLPSQGAVQRTCIGHVSLIRTCTGKNHVQSKGKLCDHVEAVGNIGSPNLYPIAPIPNLSSLSITFLKPRQTKPNKYTNKPKNIRRERDRHVFLNAYSRFSLHVHTCQDEGHAGSRKEARRNSAVSGNKTVKEPNNRIQLHTHPNRNPPELGFIKETQSPTIDSSAFVFQKDGETRVNRTE
ncbi:hypothetical protein Bca4012_094415 [Brassica carinata]